MEIPYLHQLNIFYFNILLASLCDCVQVSILEYIQAACLISNVLNLNNKSVDKAYRSFPILETPS